jgi:hypothetical protein
MHPPSVKHPPESVGDPRVVGSRTFRHFGQPQRPVLIAPGDPGDAGLPEALQGLYVKLADVTGPDESYPCLYETPPRGRKDQS